jgi:PRTRC genetic system protein E
METNFFQQLNAFGISGNIVLNIQPLSQEKMIVSILITNDSIKDKAVKNIPPMVLDGSITDLDEKFFSAISEPVKKTTELFRNLLDHEKGLKTAIGNNNMQKGKNEADKTKRKQFDEKMKKVDELEKEKKYGQAIAQMPDAKAFLEFAEEINKKMTQLRGSHGTLDLFAAHESGGHNEVSEVTGIDEDNSERKNDSDNHSLEDDDYEKGLDDDNEDDQPED